MMYFKKPLFTKNNFDKIFVYTNKRLLSLCSNEIIREQVQ